MVKQRKDKTVSMNMFADTILKSKDRCEYYFNEDYVPHGIAEDFREIRKERNFENLGEVVRRIREKEL